MSEMKKVLLVNQGHTDNIGDQLISEITGRQLSDFFSISVGQFIPDEPVTRIRLEELKITGEKNKKQSYILEIFRKNYVLSLEALTIKYYKKIIGLIEDKYDAILIGGGELLADYVVFIAALQAWLFYAHRTNTKVLLYGVSGLPFAKKKHRFLKHLLRECTLISVRDRDTQCHLLQYLKKEISYAPDIVFSMNSIYGDLLDRNCLKKDIFVSIYSPEELGISKCAEYYDEWIRLILEKLDDSIDNVLIGYTTQSDYYAAREFYNYIQGNPIISNINWKLCDYSDWRGYCGIVSKCKYVMTGRMHAMIIALQCGCEVVPYIVKRKIDVFYSEYVEKRYDMFSVNERIFCSLELVKKKIDD